MPVGRGIDNAGWSGADYTANGYSTASGRGSGTSGNVWGGAPSAPRFTDTYSGPPQTPATAGTPNAGGSGGAGATPNPWMQNVWGTINGNQTNFATPTNPNVNYITQAAAQNLGSLLGANVVEQNLTNMASPGSAAPSAPMYGLDFGYGGPQNAGQVQFWLDRGDRIEDIKARLSAGLNNTGWGGPGPQGIDYSSMWNMNTPVSRNTSQDWSAQMKPQETFGFDTWMKNRAAEQKALSNNPLANPQTNPTNQTPSGGSQNNLDMDALLKYLAAVMFGGGFMRQPQLSGGNNLLRNYYYPQSEPNLGG